MKTFTISERERNDIVEALLQCLEYLEPKMDADGDSIGWTPNTEMRLYVLCEEALAGLPGSKELV